MVKPLMIRRSREPAKEILDEQAKAWASKPALRKIYSRYFDLAFQSCLPGSTLELGAGSGVLKKCGYSVLSTDLETTSGIDVVSDAQLLPFRDKSFDNIFAIDVFHHIERPVRLLREACRVLKPGGRLVLLEPGITWTSFWFYNYFHPDPVDIDADPLLDGPIDSKRHPFEANQGLATVLVTKKKKRLEEVVPGISIIEHRWIGSLAYPLSGGFQSWSLVPSALVRPALALEWLLDSTLGRWCGFRLLITLERNLIEH